MSFQQSQNKIYQTTIQKKKKSCQKWDIAPKKIYLQEEPNRTDRSPLIWITKYILVTFEETFHDCLKRCNDCLRRRRGSTDFKRRFKTIGDIMETALTNLVNWADEKYCLRRNIKYPGSLCQRLRTNGIQIPLDSLGA